MTRSQRYRIPTRITLPFQYRIKVVQLTDEAMTEAWRDRTPPIAAWSWTDRTIILRRSRPLPKRRQDLIHELQHAVLDWVSDMQASAHVTVKV
jgi:Zn-dependent peptidase ImmA (M78 family)